VRVAVLLSSLAGIVSLRASCSPAPASVTPAEVPSAMPSASARPPPAKSVRREGVRTDEHTSIEYTVRVVSETDLDVQMRSLIDGHTARLQFTFLPD
jgi:hypothetical protein